MIVTDTCDQILRNIHENMPGTTDTIVTYLRDTAERYASHPCSKEVIREIALIATQVLPDASFHSFFSGIPDADAYLNVILDEITRYIETDHIEKAEAMIRYILPYADADTETIQAGSYVSFRDFIEYAYYITCMSPEEDLPVRPYPGTAILSAYARIMAVKGEREAAYRIFHQLCRISPVNDAILFELADLYRADGNHDAFRTVTERSLRYAWKPEELARSYRNMGHSLTETGDYPAAITCYLMATTWEDSPDPARDIARISEISGASVDITYYLSHGEEILKERNIPFGPNPEIIELMVRYADECKEDGDFFEARKYLSRAKALQLSDDLERQIEVIERYLEDATMF